MTWAPAKLRTVKELETHPVVIPKDTLLVFHYEEGDLVQYAMWDKKDKELGLLAIEKKFLFERMKDGTLEICRLAKLEA